MKCIECLLREKKKLMSSFNKQLQLQHRNDRSIGILFYNVQLMCDEATVMENPLQVQIAKDSVQRLYKDQLLYLFHTFFKI